MKKMKGGSTSGKNYASQSTTPVITLAIRSQDGDVVYYRVAANKKMGDLLKSYCEGKKFKFREMVFLHNGDRIKTSKTLAEHGVANGDELDAMRHHDGGGNLTTFP